MKSIKCGIIGCGVIAPSHVESFKNLPGVELLWACDLVESKAAALAGRHGIPKVCSDYRVVVNDPEVDCVSVCTDHGSHAMIVCDALDHGKHVICEKALGATPRCLELMGQAHRRNPGLVFAGIFQHRFELQTRHLKKLIDTGAFGTLTTINLNCSLLRTNEYYRQDAWRGTRAGEGGSLLINQAIHYVDLINWLSGGVESLCARCDNLTHHGVIETEDSAAIIMKFRKGMVGGITATSSSIEPWRHLITISGTDGYVEFLNDNIRYYKFSSEEVTKELAGLLSLERGHEEGVTGKVYYGEGHPAQIKDFVEAIREGRKPFVPAESACSTVELIHACYDSARNGCWVSMSLTP